MVLEIIVVGVVGIAGTLAGILANNFLERRKEQSKSKIEEWKLIVDTVYSPLIFDLLNFRRGILLSLNAIGKTLSDFEGKPINKEFIDSLTLFVSITAPFKHSTRLEEILRKNSRLVKPTTLWLDLSLFQSYLNEVEEIFDIISVGRFNGSPQGLLSSLNICI